jgi:hypothetical protein
MHQEIRNTQDQTVLDFLLDTFDVIGTEDKLYR